MAKKNPENEQPQNEFKEIARELDSTLIDLQLKQFSKSKHTSISKIISELKKERSSAANKVIVFSAANAGLRIIAAKMFATELDIPLYLLDLPAANEKYIGKKEKNLSDLFDAASEVEGVLLVDDADALFANDEDSKVGVDISLDDVIKSAENAEGVLVLTCKNFESSAVSDTKAIKHVLAM